MVLHDYHCTTHGYFEGWNDSCPIKNCTGEVSKVFLQPVGIKSDKTKHADKTLEGLAQQFGMTDIKSTREGESQGNYASRNNSQNAAERERELAAASREPRPGDAAIWGGAGKINMAGVMGGMFKPVADEAVSVLPSSVGNLTGPKTASYVADHENLSIQK